MAGVLAVAAVGTQISYPLTHGDARDGVSIAVVLLWAASCAVHAATTRGKWWMIGLLVVTAGGGLLVEILGTATGVPFGSYTYASGRLGPELAGVPLLIGAAWTAGAYPAWCAAERLAQRRGVRVVLAAVGLAAWDLYLDPQMVADGRWHWAPGSTALPGLAGIPLSNYVSWLLTALAMALALSALPRSARGHSDAVPIGLYLWTWLGSGLAQVAFLGLPVSAAYGFLAMGVLGVPLLWNLRRAGPATRLQAHCRLARWARASFGDRTLPPPPDTRAGRGAADRSAPGQRVPSRPDEHGDIR